MTTYTTRKRVAEGARFLDQTMPDWRSMVRVETLAMQHLNTCVLGQLFGEYARGKGLLAAWWLDNHPTGSQEDLSDVDVLHGFESGGYVNYSDLHDEWLRVIANEPECDGCDQDPWRAPVHYGTCPLNERQDA